MIPRNLSCVLLIFIALQSPAQNNNHDFKKDIQALAAILQIPGYSLAVVKDGQVVCRYMNGYSNLEQKTPVRESDLFMIASVTKTFTANLIMQYEQEHLSSLDDFVLQYRYIDIGFGWPYNINANSRIRHFLSHTSEDGPGNSFVYNGSRFNYIYGVFEAAGNHSSQTDAYKLELQKRVLDPLEMKHTIFGFPSDSRDTLFKYIATPYLYDSNDKKFIEDTLNYKRWTRAFPSGGLLSTIDDLVTYTSSYDHHILISKESYEKVTTPTILSDGSSSPYGLGWFTETFAGQQLHWHYGQADSYASLFIRVPGTGYTFIFLSNSNAPSEALRLGSGKIWESPFASAFLKHFIFTRNSKALQLLKAEEAIGRALFLRYAENRMGTHRGESAAIIAALKKSNPERFEQYDPGLIYLLTDLNNPSFRPLIDKQAAVFQVNGHIQPYVITDLANYYLSCNMQSEALALYKKLADAKGFEFWQLSVDAARKAGKILMHERNIAEAREYYWKAINNMKLQWADDRAIREVIDEMNKSR